MAPVEEVTPRSSGPQSDHKGVANSPGRRAERRRYRSPEAARLVQSERVAQRGAKTPVSDKERAVQSHAENAENASHQPDEGLPQVSPTSVQRRVLLAEDDASLRQLLASVMRADGYEVIEVADGVQLLDAVERTLAKRDRPDGFLIVADIHMPGLTGLDVLAVLRCAYASTPVVLITAFPDQEARAEARDLGAVAMLAKPFSVDELRAVVLEAAPPLG